MKIAILQTDIKPNNQEQNINNAEALLSSGEDADLYVLPEMWSTGFFANPKDIDKEIVKQSLSWMRKTARAKSAAICGSLPIVDNTCNAYKNRLFFIYPDGSECFYDKHHLFGYGGEKTNYVAGNERKIVNLNGWRFLLLTCYDLRFPKWCRYNEDYDAIIVVANWPETRIDAWNVLVRARAIENQCLVIGCNRVGRDSQNYYNGNSLIVDGNGNVISGGPIADSQQIIYVDICKNAVAELREKFNVFEDHD